MYSICKTSLIVTLSKKRETIKRNSGDASFDDFDQLIDVVCLDAVPTLGDDDTFAFAKSQLRRPLDDLVHLWRKLTLNSSPKW